MLVEMTGNIIFTSSNYRTGFTDLSQRIRCPFSWWIGTTPALLNWLRDTTQRKSSLNPFFSIPKATHCKTLINTCTFNDHATRAKERKWNKKETVWANVSRIRVNLQPVVFGVCGQTNDNAKRKLCHSPSRRNRGAAEQEREVLLTTQTKETTINHFENQKNIWLF